MGVKMPKMLFYEQTKLDDDNLRKSLLKGLFKYNNLSEDLEKEHFSVAMRCYGLCR